jgi:hypothetical protein
MRRAAKKTHLGVGRETMQKTFAEAFNAIQAQVHATAKEKGWWGKERSDALPSK